MPQQPELRGEIPAAFAELLALLPALSSRCTRRIASFVFIAGCLQCCSVGLRSQQGENGALCCRPLRMELRRGQGGAKRRSLVLNSGA